jgi:hypothetical protein
MNPRNEVVRKTEVPAKLMDRKNYDSFREHSEIHHHLRLHHAIYLDHLIQGGGGQWRYKDLSDWMKSSLNRFFELVDRVALTRQKVDSWREAEAGDIIGQGERWIESLFSVKEILIPECKWGSAHTYEAWDDLRGRITSVIEDHSDITPQTYTTGGEGRSGAYEIFSGGFEYVPTIGTFPFYLFGERLGAWGIVKYARLDSLAMATNELTLSTLGFKPKELPVPDRIGSASTGKYENVAASEVTTEEFSKVFKSAGGRKTCFYYFGAGHAAVSLLLRILNVETFVAVRKHIGPMSESCIKSLLVGQNKRAIVLCDLGDQLLAEYVRPWDPAEGPDVRRLLVLRDLNLPVELRRLNVPVGLGFSLAALPLLLSRPVLFTQLVKTVQTWRAGLQGAVADEESIGFYDGISMDPVGDISLPWNDRYYATAEIFQRDSNAPTGPSSKTMSDSEDGLNVNA